MLCYHFIQTLQFEIDQLKDDVSHYKSISHDLKKMIRDQEIGTPVLSPEDSDVSYCPCLFPPQIFHTPRVLRNLQNSL